MYKYLAKLLLPAVTCLAQINNNDAYIPEHWANEAVAILVENMAVANLVHRDFENEIKEYGDVVNTRKPNEFVAKRKGINDDVTVQDAKSTNIQVPLDQHVHVSFLIRDRDMSLAFQNLLNIYLRPAVIAMARHIDKICLAQAPRFLRTDQYQPGSIGVAASVASVLETGEKMNDDKCPPENRNMLISPRVQTDLLSLDTFLNADKVGDDGTALREASLGRRLGFNFYMCQNVCKVTGVSTTDTSAGAINNGNIAAGSTVLTVDGITGATVVGTFLTIAGEMIPHRVTAVSNNTAGNTIGITITPPLKTAVVDNAVITFYEPGAVNQSLTDGTGGVTDGWATAGYEAKWEKYITVDGFTNAMKVGQFLTVGAGGPVYTVIDAVGTTSILLDRPLAANTLDNVVLFPGPIGTYNFAFIRNALALVIRPLAVPPAESGVRCRTANFDGISIRVCWQYDSVKQGMRVTVDLLCGVAILDTLLGQVMLS